MPRADYAEQLRLAMEAEPGVPNLDGLSTEVGDLQEAARVFRLLARYAQWKAIAMRQRQAGYVNDAKRYEDICEYLYDQLPRWARW